MTKEVIITISGLHIDDEDNNSIEVVSSGMHYLKNKKHFIIYDEYSESFPNEKTKNTIKIVDPTHVEIIKQGANNVHMVFEEGKDNNSYYDTPLGSLLIGTSTSNIAFKEADDCITLDISYDLSVNYNHVSNCHINLKIESTSIV